MYRKFYVLETTEYTQVDFGLHEIAWLHSKTPYIYK